VAAANPTPNLVRYVVKGSDVISDMKVNVSEESSEQVIWYKERFLSDNEIVEHVVHNPTSTICWTIHRPKRGWYIRLRAPSFPPGTFIPMLPLPRDSPYYVEAALSFSCRTNISRPKVPPHCVPSTSSTSSTSDTDTDTDHTLVDGSSHSYPPTPPIATVVRPPSPSSVDARLSDLPPLKSLRCQTVPSASHISNFVLAPHSSPHVPTTENSPFFTRVLAAVQNHKPSHSDSFTIGLLPFVAPISRSPDTAVITGANPPQATAFVTFHDRTPLLSVHAITGLLEIDQSTARLMGVQASFWVAVALTYLEFLQERESYLAAISD